MVLQTIKERFSVRSFSDKPVSDDIITDILESARLAPSWVNVQPWHFIVVKDKETKELLSKSSHGQPHVALAPVVIACCGDFNAWKRENFRSIMLSRPGNTEERVDTLLDTRGFNPELSGKDYLVCRTVEEITYPIAYMTLEAQNQGIGACIVGWMGNELTESNPDIYKEVREKLELPDSMMLITLLLLGYPAEGVQKPNKIRKQFDSIVSYEKYGKKRI